MPSSSLLYAIPSTTKSFAKEDAVLSKNANVIKKVFFIIILFLCFSRPLLKRFWGKVGVKKKRAAWFCGPLMGYGDRNYFLEHSEYSEKLASNL